LIEKMAHPDPELLRTYVTILETGSFTAAARKVHRTQSAVSMQMRRLEKILGNELFERAGKKVKLTPNGEVYLDHARRILREYDEALGALSQEDAGSEITIGVPDDYALSFLPEILGRLIQAFPSLRLTILCEPSRRLSTLIAEGSIDIALLTEGEGIGGGIVLRRDEIVWATSAHHTVHTKDPVPLAVFHSGDVFRRSSIKRLEDHGRHARIAVSSLSFAGINAALEAGIAVAVISRANVRPGLRILTPKDGFPQLPKLGIMLQRSDREPQSLIDRLVQHIVSQQNSMAESGAAVSRHPESSST
jgi:DNA-binding transcriptional LysR family regulator